MNYLLKKIHKVSSFYENIFQSIYIMLAGYILHLIKLLLEQVRSLFFGYSFNYLVQKRIRNRKSWISPYTCYDSKLWPSCSPDPLDDKGIHISALRESGSNVAYVTPSHQFPLGIIMPLSRRLELLKWANDCNGYIIEDDYDGEFRYIGKPIPSLQGLDSNERVIYMGTFSKSFYLLYEWDISFYHLIF